LIGGGSVAAGGSGGVAGTAGEGGSTGAVALAIFAIAALAGSVLFAGAAFVAGAFPAAFFAGVAFAGAPLLAAGVFVADVALLAFDAAAFAGAFGWPFMGAGSGGCAPLEAGFAEDLRGLRAGVPPSSSRGDAASVSPPASDCSMAAERSPCVAPELGSDRLVR
jgi:hypothetical protein